MSESEAMIEFREAKMVYHKTLEFASGCGFRGQSFINNAYDTLSSAYARLSLEEKKSVKIPGKPHKNEDSEFSGFPDAVSSSDKR
jgi:hypothetical protein